MKFKTATLTVFLFSLISSPSLFAANPAPVSTHANWGNLETVTQYGNYYFANAPDEAALAAFKKVGGTAVVDLRTTKEMDCSEIALVGKLGMKYHNVQFSKTDPINKDTITQIEKIVKEADGKPVLLHCSTGNRAAAWLAVHLVEQNKVDAPTAMRVAEEAGLNSADLKTKLATYLKTNSSSPKKN